MNKNHLVKYLIAACMLVLTACGSDDGTLIIVSEFPAEGSENNSNSDNNSDSGATIIYTNKDNNSN